MGAEEFYVKSPEEMADYFKNIPEAIENTVKIAEKCNFDFEFGNTKLPNYEVPKEYPTHADFFKELCRTGLNKRYGDNPSKEVQDRLEYEIAVIEIISKEIRRFRYKLHITRLYLRQHYPLAEIPAFHVLGVLALVERIKEPAVPAAVPPARCGDILRAVRNGIMTRQIIRYADLTLGFRRAERPDRKTMAAQQVVRCQQGR